MLRVDIWSFPSKAAAVKPSLNREKRRVFLLDKKDDSLMIFLLGWIDVTKIYENRLFGN